MSKDRRLPVGVVPPATLSFLKSKLRVVTSLPDSIIRNNGVRVLVTPHVVCPCLETQDYRVQSVHKADCTHCLGSGIVYLDKSSFETRALVSGLNEDTQHLSSGELIDGSIGATFSSDVDIDEGDKLFLPDIPVSTSYMRKYRASVGGIRFPFKVASITRAVTKGSRPNSELIVLRRGTDYGLDENDYLMYFPDGSSVTNGMNVSMVLSILPYYIIDSLPRASRHSISTLFSGDGSEQSVKLPTHAVAVRADLVAPRLQHEVVSRGSID